MKVRKFLALAIAFCILAATLLVSGCNTVKGAGKDIEEAGKAIQGE